MQLADACAPLVALKVAEHADLLRSGGRREVGCVLLVVRARDRDGDLVVRVLHVLYPQAAEDSAVLLDAALSKSGEGIHLVRRHIYYLRDLGGCPAVVPHIAVNAQHVVVLVNLVAALLRLYALGGVVLVVRIHVPALDAVRDVAALVEVPLALEARVLDEVLLEVTVLHRPLRLEAVVRDAKSVNRDAVAIYEHVAVRGDGIAVRMVETVSVVERAAVGAVAHAVLPARAVVHAEARGVDVAHQALAGGGHSVRKKRCRSVVNLRADFKGVAVLAWSEAVETHLLVAAARIGRSLGKVLHGERSADTCKIHIATHITATKNQLSRHICQIRDICHSHHSLLCSSLNNCRRNSETRCHSQSHILFETCSHHS